MLIRDLVRDLVHGQVRGLTDDWFSSGFSLAKPTATWISDAATAQAVFQIDAPLGIVATNKVRGRASLSPTVGTDGKFTSVLEEVSAVISVGDLSDYQIDDFAFAPFANGLTYVQFWITDASDVQISAVSDTISETIAATTGLGQSVGLFPYIYLKAA